jgi:hypothetical protein
LTKQGLTQGGRLEISRRDRAVRGFERPVRVDGLAENEMRTKSQLEKRRDEEGDEEEEGLPPSRSLDEQLSKWPHQAPRSHDMLIHYLPPRSRRLSPSRTRFTRSDCSSPVKTTSSPLRLSSSSQKPHSVWVSFTLCLVRHPGRPARWKDEDMRGRSVFVKAVWDLGTGKDGVRLRAPPLGKSKALAEAIRDSLPAAQPLSDA